MQGKSGAEVAELHAGDIGAIAKLKETFTGDTLGDKCAPIYYPAARIPEPSITFAIEPKTRADEDRIGQGIHKILEEDLALRFSQAIRRPRSFCCRARASSTSRWWCAKLRKRFRVDLTLKPPKVPYRETIRAKADAEGKHKKQTGGHGQFGVCRVRMEPLPRGAGFEFVDDIFGGAIPKNYIPSVEKGIRAAAERGYLAGFPVVDFRAVLYDGKYHDVDSSDMAFKIAGSLAFKEAMKQARPTLLEPIMHVEVYAPDQYSGDIMGDLSSRRGRISGSEARGRERGGQRARCRSPRCSAMHGFDVHDPGASQLLDGVFATTTYVPNEIAEKVIAQARASARGRSGPGAGSRLRFPMRTLLIGFMAKLVENQCLHRVNHCLMVQLLPRDLADTIIEAARHSFPSKTLARKWRRRIKALRVMRRHAVPGQAQTARCGAMAGATAKSLVLIAAGVLAYGVTGCEDWRVLPLLIIPFRTLRQHRSHWSSTPYPLVRDRPHVAALGAIPPDGVQRLVAQVEAAFAAGQVEYQADIWPGRGGFDRAMDLLLSSGFDVQKEPVWPRYSIAWSLRSTATNDCFSGRRRVHEAQERAGTARRGCRERTRKRRRRQCAHRSGPAQQCRR